MTHSIHEGHRCCLYDALPEYAAKRLVQAELGGEPEGSLQHSAMVLQRAQTPLQRMQQLGMPREPVFAGYADARMHQSRSIAYIASWTNRRKVVDRIVSKPSIYRWIDRVATAHAANRVSIGCSFRHEFGTSSTTGACPIVNHRRAAEAVGYPAHHDAGADVRAAARRKRHDATNRPRGVGLCQCWCADCRARQDKAA